MLLQTVATNIRAFCATANCVLQSSSVAQCTATYSGLALEHISIYFTSNSRNTQFPEKRGACPRMAIGSDFYK